MRNILIMTWHIIMRNFLRVNLGGIIMASHNNQKESLLRHHYTNVVAIMLEMFLIFL